ncbi:molybdopterin converting factor [Ignicoccus pacificus DSM 13166]|uniref:Molybdopterin converting factor n=1 Tax=Ignicoccus pacificus DSM 13166 TaxID=940294 RepID=A0A977PKD3_9CREN|nr:molybdopterin converting factor [Ignicoccus pacificus DSM 13166]
MKVKVRFYAYLREKIKEKDEFECDCKTAKELFEELLRRYPELQREREEYKDSGLELGVLINGRDWRHLGEIEGDEVKVSVFPPAAGG